MAKAKANKRYKDRPGFICPTCRRTYFYNKECNGCHVMTVEREPAPEKKKKEEEPETTMMEKAGFEPISDMPTRATLPLPDQDVNYDDPNIDLSSKSLPKKSKREGFNEWMENIYGMMDEIINFGFPNVNPEIMAELQFTMLEKNQINTFVFLVLKKWFPGILDSMLTFSVGGEDASILNIVFAGAFTFMILFRKFRIISGLIEIEKLKKGVVVNEKLPPQYAPDKKNG